ncbi:PREDICTED: uncharacterized protein LOC108558848, partial [Nicrophorus vespilloides]|uniref:Uncharacterized protein LOC108558848 n=1 Tax=Nicrophorus vespilloides TaxID=110193 RepID=A0ABM1M9W7_NICVS
VCNGETLRARNPPQFEKNPQYSNSYIPAGMQIIAHLTELMKYELRPTKPGTSGTSTTTSRPTPPHRPGLYAPESPLGMNAYFALKRSDPSAFDLKSLDLLELMKRLEPGFRISDVDDLQLLGSGPYALNNLVNGLNGEDGEQDEDVRVIKFVNQYDDTHIDDDFLRQKKQPPTRAYVTLLSLYDLLNKESKKISLNKFNGFSNRVLKDLIEVSSGTAAFQLEHVLRKIVDNRNTNDQMIISKINAILSEMEKTDSYMSMALMYVPPLPYEA